MNMRNKILASLAAIVTAGVAGSAQAQEESFVGEIQFFGGDFCYRGTLPASGQTLPITSNQALYSLVGTVFGGDGRANFALPNLQGTAPIGYGPTNPVGENGGTTTITLNASNLPMHNHIGVVETSASMPSTPNVSGAALATFPSSVPIYNNSVAPNANMAAGAATAQAAGANQPVPIMYPYQVMRACVVTNGIYPQRP